MNGSTPRFKIGQFVKAVFRLCGDEACFSGPVLEVIELEKETSSGAMFKYRIGDSGAMGSFSETVLQPA